jgi:hypothetical protein
MVEKLPATFSLPVKHKGEECASPEQREHL